MALSFPRGWDVGVWATGVVVSLLLSVACVFIIDIIIITKAIIIAIIVTIVMVIIVMIIIIINIILSLVYKKHISIYL